MIWTSGLEGIEMVRACGTYECGAFDKKSVYIRSGGCERQGPPTHLPGVRMGSGERVRKGIWCWRKRWGFVWIGVFGELELMPCLMDSVPLLSVAEDLLWRGAKGDRAPPGVQRDSSQDDWDMLRRGGMLGATCLWWSEDQLEPLKLHFLSFKYQGLSERLWGNCVFLSFQ